ncbi:hypothetical protein SUNI508_13390 [Seiridium unicorne]|uniref:Uncharacterized protein n=1 Tax=Seiridium unicorne TaxID=138068 RepID=A0ABR2VD67_9PEZI
MIKFTVTIILAIVTLVGALTDHTIIATFNHLSGQDDFDNPTRIIGNFVDKLTNPSTVDLARIPDGSTGVTPFSPPNVALYQQDRPSAPAIVLSRHHAVELFDLDYFYFGCTFGPAKIIKVGVSRCLVTARGFRNGSIVAVQTFEFRPKLTLRTGMVKAQLSVGYRNIDKVTFTTDNYRVTRSGRTLLDNIKYTVHEGV